MKSMAFHPPSDNVPGLHPFLQFCISMGLMIFAKQLDGVNEMLDVVVDQPLHIPPVVIELIQCLAYLGTTLVGTIAALKFWAEVRIKIKKPKLPKKK